MLHRLTLLNFSGAYALPIVSPSFIESHSGVSLDFSSNIQRGITSTTIHPWYFDSGATNHITNSLQNLDQPQLVAHSSGVMVGNGSSVQVSYNDKGYYQHLSPLFSYLIFSTHLTLLII